MSGYIRLRQFMLEGRDVELDKKKENKHIKLSITLILVCKPLCQTSHVCPNIHIHSLTQLFLLEYQLQETW